MRLTQTLRTHLSATQVVDSWQIPLWCQVHLQSWRTRPLILLQVALTVLPIKYWIDLRKFLLVWDPWFDLEVLLTGLEAELTHSIGFLPWEEL